MAIDRWQYANILNSSGWVVTDSSQLLAGAAAVGSVGILGNVPVNVLNSAGWVFAQSNTAGGTISIINTAGGTVSVINTAGMTVSVINSAGWTVGVGSTSIVNSAGWIVSITNTAGQTVNVINSAGWVTITSAQLATPGTARAAGMYDVGGNLLDEVPTFRTINRDFANVTASGTTQVVGTQGGTLRIRVLAATVISSTATSVKFQGGATDISSTFPTADRGGFVLPYTAHGWFQTGTNVALNINLVDNANAGCQVIWVQAS